MVNDIKQDLINKISNTNDENLCLLLKTDYEYFTQNTRNDATDNLNEDDMEELKNLVKSRLGIIPGLHQLYEWEIGAALSKPTQL